MSNGNKKIKIFLSAMPTSSNSNWKQKMPCTQQSTGSNGDSIKLAQQ